ncbi:hypothetical protein SteCoe_4544 [Stentor coeruleus]|uniref:Phorbol-ester/DAG-type domain-containing protein n=1 Tax=Stentor coeruleus TaxID=5963 RepID=A0A1R2CUI5_9CILI|nr:hypothetical protein SteCoe_4544 [Stentor coeruleus]
MNKPEFQCNCKNFTKLLCKMHLSEHVSDPSAIHNPYILNINPQESTSKIIIKALIKEKQNCELSIRNIATTFESLQKQLEITLKKHLKELTSFSKDVDNLIITILNHSENIVDGNLKKTLRLSSELAKIECEKWKIVNIKGNVDIITKSIKDLSLVDINLSWIYGSEENFNDLTTSKSTQFKPQIPIVRQPQENIARKSVPVKSNNIIVAKMTCPNNHEYKWNPYAPHLSFSTKGNYDLECTVCERKFSKSCWRCQICNIYACEQCSNAIGIPCPKLVCLNKHELVYRSDVNSYYESKGLGNGYSCKNCNKRKTDSHWHCRSCNYDICTECGRTAGFAPVSKPPICSNNHNLSTIVIDILTWSSSQHICTICKSSAAGLVYYCQKCSYFQCEDCYILLRNPIAYHPSVMCRNSHYLNWSNEISYKCPYCFDEKNEGFMCKQCDFPMCGECSMILIEIFMEGKIKYHGEEKHILKWAQKPWTIISMNEFQCLLCENLFSNVGMFACKLCKLFICLRCFDDPNKLKKKQIPERLNIQDLNRLIILDNLFGNIRFN